MKLIVVRAGSKQGRLRRPGLCLLLALLVVFGLAGCGLGRKGAREVGTAKVPELLPEDLGGEGAGEVRVTLYFCDAAGSSLVPEERLLPKVAAIGRAALEALCAGPQTPGLRPSLPAGTRLLSLNVKPEGLCVADFSAEFARLPGGDPKAEALAVYAVVNTLTEFPTVKRVQILVAGERRETLAGYVPIGRPLARNLAFVKET